MTEAVVRFYFNEVLPDSYYGNLQVVFENAVRAHNSLCKNEDLNVGREIITFDMPSSITVCHTSLAKLITGCTDRDLKKIALAMFTKYPIDCYYELEDVFDDDTVFEDFKFEGHDALHLTIAARMAWPLLTLPLSDSLRKDWINLVSDKSTLQVVNYHTGNTPFVMDWLLQRSNSVNKNLLQLQSLFMPKTCKLSESFQRSFLEASLPMQKLVKEKFKLVLDQGRLFPVKADEVIIKICKGAENEGMYELRSRQQSGMRIYFCCDGNTIYIGGLHTKGQSDGKAQTADMKQASSDIKKLKVKK